MTTIAYKDGVIATDGRTTRGDTIVDDDSVKRYERRGAVFWMSGRPHEFYAVLDDIIDRSKSGYDDYNAGGIALIEGELFNCGYCNGEGWRYPLTGKVEAYGSGADHAMTAMDMGATAREAVAMAARRDTGTGGTIRQYDAKSGEELDSGKGEG